MKARGDDFEKPTDANTISVGFGFDGEVCRNTFFLFGKMWDHHTAIALKLRRNGALIAPAPELGVYLVLSSKVVRSIDDYASDFVVRKHVAPQIIEWVRKGASPLVEDDLFIALNRGVSGYATRMELRRQVIAGVADACADVTNLLDEVIEMGRVRARI